MSVAILAYFWPVVLGLIVFFFLLNACLWRMRMLEEKRLGIYRGPPNLALETPDETEV